MKLTRRHWFRYAGLGALTSLAVLRGHAQQNVGGGDTMSDGTNTHEGMNMSESMDMQTPT